MKEKVKGKAKAGRKQKKDKVGGIHIEFDHRMEVDPPASSSGFAQDGNKRPIDALASVQYGDSSPKRQKPISSQGLRKMYGLAS
jgi:hypothetical protein